VFSIVWKNARTWVVLNLLLRAVSAALPLALLAISRIIIDGVTDLSAGKPLEPNFWLWIGLEVVLAISAAVLGRTSWYVDTVLADRFSHHLSVKIMRHASALDLAQYEDASFHDKLERARLQATDRAPLIGALGMLIQQTATAISLCIGILWFSPWVLLLMVLCLLPAFAGESHFAFVGYSLATQQTPDRRRLDYLRYLGASKDSAKELKLFSLSDFFSSQFTVLSQRLFDQNQRVWRRRLLVGAGLSLFTTAAYYGAYVYVVWRAVQGEISVGTLTFLTGSIAGATGSLQSIFGLFSSIADQTLFLSAVAEFFEIRPT